MKHAKNLKEVRLGAEASLTKQVAPSGNEGQLVTTTTHVVTKVQPSAPAVPPTVPASGRPKERLRTKSDQSPATAQESLALAEAKRQSKVLVDYLGSADTAWAELRTAELMLSAAKEQRKEDIASYVSPTVKVAPVVTVGYLRLGKALLRLEQLIAEGRLTRNLYRHWWGDQQHIPFAKHSRAIDIASYYEKEEEVAGMTLTQALKDIKHRKAIELGNSPQAIDCADSIKHLTSRITAFNDVLDKLSADQFATVMKADIFAQQVAGLAQKLAPLAKRLGIG